MKIGIICIVCEIFTVIGILYAFVCKAAPEEILAGVLVMLLVSLTFVRTDGKKNGE